MTIHPLATPFSAPAQPELTGGRKVGVLLSHGFTGQPASITPWGQALAAQGVRRRGAAAARPRHHLAGDEQDHLGATGTPRSPARSTSSAPRTTRSSSAGSRWAARWCCGSPRTSADRVAGVMVVNPAVATKRFDVKLLPVLKHLVPSFPGIANDIKKPGVEEHGYTKTPLKAAHSMMQAWPTIVGRPAEDHRAVPLLPLDRGPRRRRDVPADHHQRDLLARRHRRTSREQLPRRDPRQRRREDLRGVAPQFVARVTQA